MSHPEVRSNFEQAESQSSRSCGTITVLPGFDPDAVVISNCSVGTDEIGEGELGVVNVSVRNNQSGQSATATIGVEIVETGTTVDTQTLTLSPNQVRSRTFTIDQATDLPSGFTGTFNVRAKVVSASEASFSTPTRALDRLRQLDTGTAAAGGLGVAGIALSLAANR